MRSRRARLEMMADEGERGARAGARPDRPPRRVHRRLPGGDHDRLDRDRLPGRAGRWPDLLEPVFGGFSHGVAAAIASCSRSSSSPRSTSRSASSSPKLLAITSAEEALRTLSRPLGVFRAVSAPFTAALNRLSNAIVRLFGVRPEALEESHTSEDMKVIIRPVRAGRVARSAARPVMLGGVFHLHEQQAREVMTPIPAVVTMTPRRPSRRRCGAASPRATPGSS